MQRVLRFAHWQWNRLSVFFMHLPHHCRRWKRMYRRRKRAIKVIVATIELMYIFISIPLRIGLFYDPYNTFGWLEGWTITLTVFSIMDVLADSAAILGLREIFHARRRKLAAIAVGAGGAFVNPRARAKRQKRSQRSVLTAKSSMIITWSLNTLVPESLTDVDIRSSLALEIASMVPMELLAIPLGPNSLHLLRFFKVLRLHRVPACLHEIKTIFEETKAVQFVERTANAILLHIVAQGLTACHWLACGYLLIAHLECGIDYSLCSKGVSTNPAPGVGMETMYTCWAIEDRLIGASTSRKYARAIYWASKTMVTVGLYDVAPVTNAETIYGLVAQILGAIFSTSLIAAYLFIFRYQNRRKQEFMSFLDDTVEFMEANKFPQEVRARVLAYYNNVWTTHQSLQQGGVIERLPEHLRVSVFSVLKSQRLHHVPFLAKESDEFINTLSLKMAHQSYSPKDWIIQKVPDGMYFLLRGAVFQEFLNQSQPRRVNVGEYFAENSLLFSGKADETARAITFTEVYKLPQSDFRKTLCIFYRERTEETLENMRSMLTRTDQQSAKMKRMLGRTSGMAIANLRRGSSITLLGKSSEVAIHWKLPGSTFRLWWEHARFLFIVLVAFEVPYFVVFDWGTYPFGVTPIFNLQSIFSIGVEVFFFVDLILRARYFAYVDQFAMITVTDPSYIFQKYKESGLVFDALSVVPLAALLEFTQLEELHMLGIIFRLIRLGRLQYFNAVLGDICHQHGISSKVRYAVRLFLYVTLALHFTACSWFWTALQGYSATTFKGIHENMNCSACLMYATQFSNCSWAINDAYAQIGTVFPIQDATESMYPSSFAYLRSIYWAIVTLTTVGYGDIVAYSTLESYFAAVWVFIGGIINYSVVGAMSTIISNLTARSRNFSDKMNTVNIVLAHFRISEDVRSQIRRYYHQQVYIQKVASEDRLLSSLPRKLKHQVSLILHADSVKRVPLFCEITNDMLLNQLTGLFRRRIYQRGDNFALENVCQEMFVIIRGRVNIFAKEVRKTPIGALSDGDCYGTSELILRKSLPTILVAASVVEVSVISQQAFSKNIESRFPMELEQLKLKAAKDDMSEMFALQSIIDNLQTQPTLTKFVDKCTSMFAEKDTWLQQQKKRQRKLYWDLVMLMINLYNIFAVLYRIGFLPNPSNDVWLILVLLDATVDLALAMDVLLKLYYFECEGGLSNVFYRTERDDNYAVKGLRLDLMSILPTYYIGSNFFIMSICRVPRLLRVLILPSMLDSLIMRLQQRFASQRNISGLLGPIILVLYLVIAAHLAGSIYYLICRNEDHPNSWVNNDIIIHQSQGEPLVVYIRALYWALTTLTLVGSRDIVPLGAGSTLWAAATCLCCTFIVGHIVGELSDLILQMDKHKKEMMERVATFEQFAEDHDLPASIRHRVLHYFQFQHLYLKGMDIYATFQDLSPNLKLQLMVDLHSDILPTFSLAPFLSKAHLHALVMRLRSEIYIPGDTIVTEGDHASKLYIVKYGMVMVLWRATGTAVATLNTGSLFGEVAFFLRGQRRIATIQATLCSELLVLDWGAWNELLSTLPPEESSAMQKSIKRWVRDRLKAYSVITMQIAKEIMFGDGPPPTGQAVHKKYSTYKPVTTPILHYQDSTRGFSGHIGDQSIAKTLLGYIQNASQFFTSRQSSKGSRVYAAESRSSMGSISDDNKEKEYQTCSKQSYMSSARKSLPFVKLIALKNDSAVQINPVSPSKREFYGNEELNEMEDECWRRYKVAIFMADSFQSSFNKREKANKSGDKKNEGVRRTRRTLCGPDVKLKKYGNGEAVTTDDMRFLSNYQKRPVKKVKIVKKHGRLHRNMSSVGLTALDGVSASSINLNRQNGRRRMLKRSQSLPLFNRNFAEMIREELEDSNRQYAESKLSLDYELLERCRQPQFAKIFRIYMGWTRYKQKWFHSAVSEARAENTLASLQLGLLTKNKTAMLKMGFNAAKTAKDFFVTLGRLSIIWECIFNVIALYYAISLPIILCFYSFYDVREELDADLTALRILCTLIDAICILDVILRRTVFLGADEARTGAAAFIKATSSNSWLTTLLSDTLIALPLDLWLLFSTTNVLSSNWFFYLGLCQLNKLVIVYQSKVKEEQLIQALSTALSKYINDTTLHVMQALLSYLVSGHWIGCGWYLASKYAQSVYHISWMTMSKMMSIDLYASMSDISYTRRYLRSVHFSIGSISTVFYGDISSSNIIEVLVEIGLILVCILIFGMLVAAHGERLEAKYKREMAFEQNLAEIYHFVKNNEVPKAIRERLRQYYTNTWLRYHGHEDFEALENLSILLAEDVAQHTLKSFAAEVTVLQSCDESFLRSLLKCLKHVICSPNEVVVRKGDVDRGMYFIANGKILVHGTGFELVKESGDFFGELSLLYGIPRSATCSSLGMSLLYVLEWETYERLLIDYPEYREKNRREWVVVSTVLQTGESRFRSIINIVARMEKTNWVRIDEIIKKAKNLK